MGVDEGEGEKRVFPWMMTASLACLSLCGVFAIRGYPLLGLGIAIGGAVHTACFVLREMLR